MADERCTNTVDFQAKPERRNDLIEREAPARLSRAFHLDICFWANTLVRHYGNYRRFFRRPCFNSRAVLHAAFTTQSGLLTHYLGFCRQAKMTVDNSFQVSRDKYAMRRSRLQVFM